MPSGPQEYRPCGGGREEAVAGGKAFANVAGGKALAHVAAGKGLRDEWLCPTCGTSNWLRRTCCRVCVGELGFGVGVGKGPVKATFAGTTGAAAMVVLSYHALCERGRAA